ncbi:hypothetical protein CROQUDRAFT_170736 [Cronartium quercuum f. sp. fusiforme G11]|uniref:Uncharacterized protein n=1 Tax=Cronartium quercuum f. sp. fusiforme G11 TaxID=708437 RepID=A0A9P6NGH2_9BASI|nr:hypothetical protein CROQUDRAFT_170736 [Cronartium quercuum f. sp. fusiforme G11]
MEMASQFWEYKLVLPFMYFALSQQPRLINWRREFEITVHVFKAYYISRLASQQPVKCDQFAYFLIWYTDLIVHMSSPSLFGHYRDEEFNTQKTESTLVWTHNSPARLLWAIYDGTAYNNNFAPSQSKGRIKFEDDMINQVPQSLERNNRALGFWDDWFSKSETIDQTVPEMLSKKEYSTAELSGELELLKMSDILEARNKAPVMNLWNEWKSNQIDFIQTASHYSNMDIRQLGVVTLTRMYYAFSYFLNSQLLQVAPLTSFLELIKNPGDFWSQYDIVAARKRELSMIQAISKAKSKNPTTQANPGAKRTPKRQRVQ